MIAPDSIATGLGPVTIQPIHHASLMLGWGGNTLLVDPSGGAGRFAGLPAPTAILYTHEHSDHFDGPTLEALVGDREVEIVASPGVCAQLPDALRAGAKRLGNGEKGSIAGLPLEALPAYNTTPERLKFHPRGLCNGYVLDFGGTRLYIAGDTEDIPEMRALADIAVAFLPMNLPYTMTGEQAAAAVRAFRPAVVYPFHYLRGAEPDHFAAALAGEAGIEVRQRDWYA